MTDQPTSAASASLPPLPDFGGNGGGGGNGPQTGNQDALASLMSGIAPIKKNTDAIIQAAKEIVKLGTIPGAEQIAAQIISLATSLVPMAAQNLLNPMGGAAQGSMSQMLPPPGGPAPLPQ
ncbi:MAG: hypothetical protein KGL39_34475 [Patescibacteria group bacterium]|nr:hypothetical protein [Patescibacteria group bacterium]